MAEKLNLKTKSILMHDTAGLALEQCLALGKDFGETIYFTPFATGFPQFKDYAVGLGMENITKKPFYFHDYLRDVDMVMFADTGYGSEAHFVVKKEMKIPCYSSGLGERLEDQRLKFRAWQKSVGLPTQKTIPIKGITDLEKYCKAHPDKYVKVDRFRGDVDSFKSDEFADVKNKILKGFGPFSDDMIFCVEDVVESDIEEPLGIDAFFSHDWYRPLLLGIEYHKACYIGKVVNKLRPAYENLLTKLTPKLRQMDVRSAVSVEFMVGKDGKPYIIDMSCRFPFPLSASYTEFITNYSELIWRIAHKETLKLEYQSGYVGVLPIQSTNAAKDWTKLRFDHKLGKNVKLRCACRTKKDEYFAVTGIDVVYVLIAWADSIKQIVKELERLADKVHAYGLDTEITGGLHKIFKMTDKLGWD
jgi:hypothetical protein